MGVVVVGLGDDGPAGLLVRARQVIEDAQLLVGGRRQLAFYQAHRAKKLTLTNNVDQVIERLAQESRRRRCVVLASGDPCFFGIGPLLVERLGREQVEIMPQISSVGLAFARLGLAWQDATVLSAHGRPLAEILDRAVKAEKLAVLTDDVNTPAAVAAALIEGGRIDGPAYVCEHLGGAEERIVESRLAELTGQSFARLNVLVALRPDGRPGLGEADRSSYALGPVIGRPEDELEHLRGQITKAEARAVTLAKLRLPRAGVLWDVGAGSGSLAIEAAGLMPEGRVFAVERDPEQCQVLQTNLERYPAPGLEVVAGAAPAALADLPAPDRVFVGGGGTELGPILQHCLGRLAGRGRLVVNAATLESVDEASTAVRAAGWSRELVQLVVSRGREIGGRTRLEALNPVFILTAWPGEEGGGERRSDGEIERRGAEGA